MESTKVKEKTIDENFSKWLINYEISSFFELNKLIEFELSTFDQWRNTFHDKVNELLKEQDKLKKKTQLSSYEQSILQMDPSDLISAEDDEYSSFEEEVLQMLIIKIYSKCEIAIKHMYIHKKCKTLDANYKKWIEKYKSELSIDLKSLEGFSEFQTLRIYNNNFKHSGSTISTKTAKEIFDDGLLYTIKDSLQDTVYTNLITITEEKSFIEKLAINNSIRLKLDKEKILDLHEHVYTFLKNISEII